MARSHLENFPTDIDERSRVAWSIACEWESRFVRNML
jgi:hypothetical protein